MFGSWPPHLPERISSAKQKQGDPRNDPRGGHDPSILDEKKKNIEKVGAGVPNR